MRTKRSAFAKQLCKSLQLLGGATDIRVYGAALRETFVPGARSPDTHSLSVWRDFDEILAGLFLGHVTIAPVAINRGHDFQSN